MASFNQQPSWKSLYIPFLPKDMVLDGEQLFDETSMKNYFEEKVKLGKVSRVDYVSKSQPNGTTKISAFVHFECWFETSVEFINYITQNQKVKLSGYNSNKWYSITSSSNRNVSRFFSVRINKTPIPEVKAPELNIHQLIASNQFMEKLIEEQKAKMEQLEAEIAGLKMKMDFKNEITTNILFDEVKNDLYYSNANIFLRESTIMY